MKAIRHRPNATQQERILNVLQLVRDGLIDMPEEYIRHHPSGDGISARYFKQVMFISECNGRISELRAKGHDIQTSKEKDAHGFSYHRLAPDSTKMTIEEYWASLPSKPVPQTVTSD